MRRTGVNVLDRIERNAAAAIQFGAIVKRSADGTIVVAVDGADTNLIDGVAEDSMLEMDVINKYSTYDPVPVITMGRVNLLIKEAAVTSGQYLKIEEDHGLVIAESSGVWTEGTSVARCLEDVDPASDTTAGLTISAGATAVTVTSTAQFAAGDMVYLDSGTEDTTSEIAVIKSIDSTTTCTLEDAVSQAFSSKDMHKIVQCEALLMI